MNIDYNSEHIRGSLEIIFALEWLGVRIEDVKEENDRFGFSSKQVYYYSVPESSTITVEDEELNNQIKTADGLIHLAKKELTNVIIKACEYYDADKDFIEDIKNNISDYCKFYAKTRTGEVWSKELGDNRLKELSDEIQKASGYQEI